MIFNLPLIVVLQLNATPQDPDLWTQGISIAISGITIVFAALLLISLFIAWLPRVLELIARIWPEVDDLHAASARESHPESLVAEDRAVIAAIGYVLHTELQRQLAAEKASSDKG